MKIESVDLFYLSIPEVRDIGDGSQDAMLVRVRAGGFEGWGQCEASPLACIAAWVAPMSHSACKPVAASVLGQTLDAPADIARIARTVGENSNDLLQAPHLLAGIDIALWDLLGRKEKAPVWALLGYREAHPKMPYASVLFGDTAAETLAKARRWREKGYRAAKFGWGPFGRTTVEADAAQVRAAREGLGPDSLLLVDAGTVWGDDVDAARKRLPVLQECRATWLEEPFVSGALAAYGSLAKETGAVKLAAGEGAHNVHMAYHLIDHGKVGYIQIDTGRIGGITPAKKVADYAVARGVTFVNHTFTTNLTLAASLHPYAGLAEHRICETPVEPTEMSATLTRERLSPGPDGLLRLPATPGLGVTVDPEVVRRHRVEVEIRVGGGRLFRSTEA